MIELLMHRMPRFIHLPSENRIRSEKESFLRVEDLQQEDI